MRGQALPRDAPAGRRGSHGGPHPEREPPPPLSGPLPTPVQLEQARRLAEAGAKELDGSRKRWRQSVRQR